MELLNVSGRSLIMLEFTLLIGLLVIMSVLYEGMTR